ncbi:hypothetical protein GGR51DRAFT_151670 [Nemania sp. FL0031]|nr:hypothetical protein GGR51DRAFT_151670 [Nemania sp. FL0031]
MRAVAHGKPEDAQKLLDAGANPSEITPKGTALGTAAILGSESSIHWLLRRGADPQLASLALQSGMSWDPHEVWPYPCRKGHPAAEPAPSHFPCERYHGALKDHMEALDFLDSIVMRFRKASLRRLRAEFIQQHGRAIGLLDTQSSAPLQEDSHYGITIEPGCAWSIGMQAIRVLNRGVAPSGIGETLMLLLVARSMATVMGETCDFDSLQQFDNDLSRWQMLFIDTVTRRHFKEAVLGIWGINTDVPTQIGPDIDVLTAFHDTIYKFIFRSAGFLELEINTDQGLVSSQRAWRLSMPPKTCDLNGGIFPGQNQYHGKTLGPNANPARDKYIRMETPRHKPPDIGHPSLSMAMLLMAGAIFGIILAFLTAISFIWSSSSISGLTHPSSRHYKTLDPVWQTALDHMSTVIGAKFSDPTILEEVKSIVGRAEEQIRLGKFTELTSLVQLVPESPSLAREIELFCSHWQQAYTIERNNYMLRTYMGHRQFESIVPHRISPRTVANVLAESPVSIGRRTSLEPPQDPSSPHLGNDDNMDNPV